MYTFTVFGVFHMIDFSCATFVRHALHPPDEETGSLREIVTHLLLMKSAIGERRGCGSFCWEKWCRAGVEGTALPRLEAVRKLASVGREAVEKGSISVTAS